jgi:predicted RecB family endonuclease
MSKCKTCLKKSHTKHTCVLFERCRWHGWKPEKRTTIFQRVAHHADILMLMQDCMGETTGQGDALEVGAKQDVNQHVQELVRLYDQQVRHRPPRTGELKAAREAKKYAFEAMKRTAALKRRNDETAGTEEPYTGRPLRAAIGLAPP